MSGADITLVNLNMLFMRYGEEIERELHVPLGCLYLTRALESAGLSVDFRDYQTCPSDEPFDMEVFLDFVKDPAPVIGLSCMANLLPFTILAAKALKERYPNHVILLGGVGTKSVEEKVLERFPWIDVIARGECEVTGPELLASLRDGGDLSGIKGVSYRADGGVRRNPEREWPIRRIRLGCEVPLSGDPIARAAEAAARSDVALVFVGTSEEYESEGFDRETMELPGAQAALIEAVARANRNTVVVLNNGAPVSMEGWIDRVPAVVEAWFPGQKCGNAISDVLFGDGNPCGKLPMTLPRRIEDNPAYINYPGENGKVLYGEGIFVGYRYYDTKKIEPLFPFGHGLSYTTFEYGNLNVPAEVALSDDPIGISVDITNTGSREGKEVVQLYLRDVESSLVRPVKELKGFAKVSLKPGETRTVSFSLRKRDFSFYDPDQPGWVAEPGEFSVLVGSSSRDIRATGSFVSYIPSE